MNIKQRSAIERKIVRRTVEALLNAGYALNIWDGFPQYRLPKNTTNKATIMRELMQTDEDKMTAIHPNGMKGWVFFVYGNDGPDVICDYTVNLEGIMSPIIDYAETLA